MFPHFQKRECAIKYDYDPQLFRQGYKITEESLSRIYYETGERLCHATIMRSHPQRLLARQTAHAWRASNMKEQSTQVAHFYSVEVKAVEYAVAKGISNTNGIILRVYGESGFRRRNKVCDHYRKRELRAR